MRGAVVIGTLIGAAFLMMAGWACPVAVVAQPVPAPLHSSNPSARLFDDTIIIKYKETALQTNDPSKRRSKMNEIATGFLTQFVGITAIRTSPILGVQRYRLGPSQQLNPVIVALRRHPDVQY